MFTLHHRNQLKQQQQQIETGKHQCSITVLDLQTLLYAQTSILYKVQSQGKVKVIPVIFGSKVLSLVHSRDDQTQYIAILKLFGTARSPDFKVCF